MVNKLLLIALLVFNIGANAQQTLDYYPLSEKNKQLTTGFLDNNKSNDIIINNRLYDKQSLFAINKSKETIWVEDSIKTYTRLYEHTPDSVIVHDWFQNTFLKVLNRNEKGNMTHAIYFTTPPNNDDGKDDPLPPIKTDSITATYHYNDTLHQYHARPWNDITQEWVADTSQYREYNEDGLLITETYKDWDRANNSGFSGGKRYNYYYAGNANGIVLYLFKKYILDIGTGEYNLGVIKEYSYIEDTTYILTKALDFMSGELINYSYDTYKHYGDTAMQHIKQYWNSADEEWVNYSKLNETYNDNGDRTYYLAQLWDTGIDNWTNYNQAHTEYNVSGNIASHLVQMFNSGEWVNYRFFTYNYSIDNNLVYVLIEAWNYLGEWENAHQFFHTYDSNGNKIQLLVQSADMMSGEWEDVVKEDYYWNEFETSSIVDINQNLLKIYPNPAKNTIKISSELSLLNKTVKIYSVSGKLIQTCKLNGNNEIEISNLPKGIYFLKINNNQQQIIGKFIKE